MIGPPTRPPHCVCLKLPTFVSVGPLPTYDGLRLVPNRDPSRLFDPVRVTALTPPPVKPLCRTSYGEMRICSCETASSENGCVPVPPPGVPEAERPNRSDRKSTRLNSSHRC